METNVGLPLEFKNTLDYAQFLDQQDPLRLFREKFYIPLMHGRESVYFTGNSLGLQPKSAQDFVLNEMENWANYAVEGHFHAKQPWVTYHELFPPLLKDIVGAKEDEITVMNSLTVNLHLLMASFYRPTAKRFRIICEAKAFPSDQYALASQAELHGFDADEVIVEVETDPGTHHMSTESIVKTIEQYADSVALVLFGGVNYYNGQVLDMAGITKAAHAVGAYCGFDLAHAAGNVPLQLHDWDVDFACWCSYKYLNSSPGGVSGVYIHERHATNVAMPRLAGWWGNNKTTRFEMEKTFDPIATADGWQLSNGPILIMAAHRAALELMQEAGIERLYQKSAALFDYLLHVLDDINKQSASPAIEIITPTSPGTHGCQVSMLMLQNGKEIFDHLKLNSVIADWREPNVIRVAPVPLYNSFEDIWTFGDILKTFLSAKKD